MSLFNALKMQFPINLFFFYLRYLLRGLGAVYIKRKIDGTDGKKDYIYRGLLQTYLQESIRAGHHLEFFIEGGRTRTGKPGIPKVKKSLIMSEKLLKFQLPGRNFVSDC